MADVLKLGANPTGLSFTSVGKAPTTYKPNLTPVSVAAKPFAGQNSLTPAQLAGLKGDGSAFPANAGQYGVNSGPVTSPVQPITTPARLINNSPYDPIGLGNTPATAPAASTSNTNNPALANIAAQIAALQGQQNPYGMNSPIYNQLLQGTTNQAWLAGNGQDRDIAASMAARGMAGSGQAAAAQGSLEGAYQASIQNAQQQFAANWYNQGTAWQGQHDQILNSLLGTQGTLTNEQNQLAYQTSALSQQASQFNQNYALDVEKMQQQGLSNLMGGLMSIGGAGLGWLGGGPVGAYMAQQILSAIRGGGASGGPTSPYYDLPMPGSYLSAPATGIYSGYEPMA